MCHLLTLVLFQTKVEQYDLMLRSTVLCWTQKKVSWRTKQLLVPIDFHSKERNAMEVNETINCLITSILQNIIFYVQHERETNKGLELQEGDLYDDGFHFWVNYPFKLILSSGHVFSLAICLSVSFQLLINTFIQNWRSYF